MCKNTTMTQYRKTPRANFLDYDGGDYFVTMCTKNRKHYFGEIIDEELHLSKIGEFAAGQLSAVKNFCPEIDIPLFVVMPNHIHAIICVLKDGIIDGDIPISQRSLNPDFRYDPTCRRHMPVLSRYISSFKGAVTKYARRMGAEFHWQNRYHDHLIRGHQDGNHIAEYIMNNVARWAYDCFYD